LRKYRLSIYHEIQYYRLSILPKVLTMSGQPLPRSTYLILLALADQPRHGLGIIDDIHAHSAGDVRMGPGTLYGTLAAAGGRWADSRDGGRARSVQ
jgi:hypothetical protein